MCEGCAQVAHRVISAPFPGSFSLSETFDVGVDNGTPVSNNYKTKDHCPCTGRIDKVTINLMPEDGNTTQEVDEGSILY